MDTLVQLLEMVLHIDKHLGVFIDQYGNWVYLFLFMIVFVETGLVLFPFLPGDSLLFIGGAFAATGAMDPWLLGVLLFVAAVTGNTLNYWIGSKIGPRVYEKNWRFLDRDALRKTHDFYEHHGGKTIVMARFVPVVRTFAPFVAGVSAMSWARFQLYNVLGAAIWVVLLVGGGYLFGNLPVVKQYLNIIVLVGISAAVVPIALGALWKVLTRGRRRVPQGQGE
ncbi:VTT domain-containing protein [Pandoraea nosoerga]|uniref:Membrane protein n=1 Tax=Pandoraea nosoerga TaxID=2508296 RepID=A0A5E4WWI2_9BURK|nr:VTT domain-containing protein [Pandoraea nosoerga]MBN4666395.1 VTT domain-containing protein [Pandoraea nosoerga]MBN4675926.1 VTT domain-containing protein [Pandoraea nosoerga]MBN4682990.1 VTT domain-containing protein [Pandoraea nosoerga]MBN4746996.1 VTT domain-containing protein [Pandoraea nosoerga]VVE27335.1 membrane protein [Pandoraea nosoerga]